MTRRGTTNRNARGSSYDRAARKRWLLEVYASDRNRWAVTQTCRCYRCGTLLGFKSLTVDRIVPGCRGGRYTRNNIRPACAPCNSETGGALSGR